MPRKNKRAFWRYIPNDDSGLAFSVPCRITEEKPDNVLIIYKDATGTERTISVPYSNIIPVEIRTAELIFECEFEEKKFGIFQVQTSHRDQFFAMVWSFSSSDNFDHEACIEDSLWDSFLEACTSFDGWEHTPFFNPLYIHPEYSLIVERFISVCLDSMPEHERHIYTDLKDLKPSAWVDLAFSPQIPPLEEDELSREEALKIKEAGAASAVEEFLQKRIPRLLPGCDFYTADLDVRTFNVCVQEGWLQNPSDLIGRKLEDILKAKSFGKKSLANLIIELAPWLPSSATSDQNRIEPKSTEKMIWPDLEEMMVELSLLTAEAEGIGVGRRDPRWGAKIKELNSEAESFHEALKKIFPSSKGSYTEIKVKLEKARTILRDIERSASLVLEDELRDITESLVKNERDQKAVLKRYGFNGEEPQTLEEVGTLFGITRERVRQVVKKFDDEIERADVYAPVLDRCLHYILQRLPKPVGLLQQELQAEGLTAGVFSITSIMGVAEILGRTPGFALNSDGTVAAIGGECFGISLIRQIRRLLKKQGVGHVRQIAEDCEIPPHKVSIISELIETVPDLIWIDRQAGLFWLKNITYSKFIRVMPSKK